MENRNKKVIVTGSKGFIGKHLVKALRDINYDVVEIDIPEINITDISIDDSQYTKLFEGADTLFHLSVMNLEHCKTDYRGCINTNIIGTATLMEMAKKVEIKRVIYSSASSIYGDPVTTTVPETHQQMPMTMYGVTKLASEKVIHSYSENFDLTYGIFRFTNVYGPGQVNGLIPNVINKILRKQLISITGKGFQTRDFVYVDDVVRILMDAMLSPKYSFICNLGSGEQYSINEIIKMISELTGLDAYTNNTQIMDKDRRTFRADITKLRSLFRNTENFIKIEEGLTKTIEWWKNGNGQDQKT